VGRVITTLSLIMCPHGGRARPMLHSRHNREVVTKGGLWLLEIDEHAIYGCPFYTGGEYSPCVRIIWTGGSRTTTINGKHVLTSDSIGMCLNHFSKPQGPPIIVHNQWEANV